MTIIKNITKEQEIKNILLQDTHDWQDIFDNITDMITIHDKDFNIIHANKAAQDVLGLSVSNDIKTKCFELYHGEPSPPSSCISCQCLKTGNPVAFEAYEPHLNKYLEVRAMPRLDKNNEIIGVIHISRDITQKKEMEEILQRAEQVKLVGEWATGLTHEIKNSLAGIKASIELILDELNISPENRSIILKSIQEIRQIEMLLKSLLSFATPYNPVLALTDMNDVLDKTIDFVMKHPLTSSNSIKALRIFKDLPTTLPHTMVDPIQLQRIFMNLIVNGIEAMPDGGTLTVRSAYDEATDSIRIELSDTGMGIEKENINKIFQPFYTTKRKKTGLGLAIVKSLVEQLKGDISVESLTGVGTKFKLIFPVNKNSGSN
jgi:two-component system, NtrC family, sensor kinase